MNKENTRVIEFRGKRKENPSEWLFGDLYHVNGDPFIRPSEDDPMYSFDYYEVIPETVGQFTGLTDKNGVKIWEGDIVKATGQDNYFIQVIEFRNTAQTSGRGWVGINKKSINKITLKEEEVKGFSYFSFPMICEVIASIHDKEEKQ